MKLAALCLLFIAVYLCLLWYSAWRASRIADENKMNIKKMLEDEIKRNEELLKVYESIPTGAFGVLMIRGDISIAKMALGSGNEIKMQRAYETLSRNE